MSSIKQKLSKISSTLVILPLFYLSCTDEFSAYKIATTVELLEVVLVKVLFEIILKVLLAYTLSVTIFNKKVSVGESIFIVQVAFWVIANSKKLLVFDQFIQFCGDYILMAFSIGNLKLLLYWSISSTLCLGFAYLARTPKNSGILKLTQVRKIFHLNIVIVYPQCKKKVI